MTRHFVTIWDVVPAGDIPASQPVVAPSFADARAMILNLVHIESIGLQAAGYQTRATTRTETLFGRQRYEVALACYLHRKLAGTSIYSCCPVSAPAVSDSDR